MSPDKIKFVRLACIVLLTVTGCEFSPSGTEYTYVDIPEQHITIDLNFPSDTVAVAGTVNFSYSVDIEGRNLRYIEVILDGTTIYTLNTLSGSFYLGTHNLAGGFHTLVLRTTSNSGTGSLADANYAEYIVAERKWALLVDNGPPNPVVLSSVSVTNTQLKLEWQKYTRPNFQNYVIYKSAIIDGHIWSYYDIEIIPDPNVTSFIDKSYVGGSFAYRVDVVASSASAQGHAKVFLDSSLKFLSISTDNSTTLNWTRCLYDSTFLNYQIFEVEGSTFHLIASIGNISTTSWTDSATVFGSIKSYALGVQAKHDECCFMFPYVRTESFIGKPMPVFAHAKFIPSLNSLYISHAVDIYRIDGNDFDHILAHNAIQSPYYIGTPFDISDNGSFAYAAYENSILKLDPVNLQETQSYPISAFSGNSASVARAIRCSNSNQIAMVSFLHPTDSYWAPEGIPIVDMDQSVLRAELVIDNRIDFTVEQSRNGQFLTDGYRLFHLEGDTLRQTGTIVWDQFVFKDDGSEVVMTNNDKISILNSMDMSVVREFSIPNSLYTPVIDPVTGYLGGTALNNNFFRIYDLNTGLLVKEIKVYSTTGTYWLLNSTLLSKAGYYMKLQY